MIEYFVIAVFSVILCIFTYETLYENIKSKILDMMDVELRIKLFKKCTETTKSMK